MSDPAPRDVAQREFQAWLDAPKRSSVAQRVHGDRAAIARVLNIRLDGVLAHDRPASANRRCPLDLFHGREPGSYRPRWNPPGDPFLLSADDDRDLFARAGCAGLALEPTEGFWTFNRSRRSLRGRLLALPVRLLFWLESRAFARRLRGSPVSPWIVAHTSKPA